MAGYDLLVRGAHVIDPTQNLNRAADIAVTNGRLARIGPPGGGTASRVIDAAGLYASPGWIDIHAHVFHSAGGNGVHPDREAGVMTGVTTVVDPGSPGASQWDGFRAYTVETAATRVLAFLNVSIASAMPGVPRHGAWDNFNQRLTIRTIDAHRDVILGVKVLASQTHCGLMGVEPVKLAVQAADLTGTKVMCHIGNAPPVIQDVLRLLRPGDVVTHCWHGKPGGILDRDGQPIREARAAAERGVVFDIGHGNASFAFETARQAMSAGFPLHSISTDIHQLCIRGPVFDMATTMSKFLHLGMGLSEVIRLSTSGPAAAIGKGDALGSLRVGREADLTLFRVEDGEFPVMDAERKTEKAARMIRPVWCIRAGNVCLHP
jgi:dihydroorotase